MILKLFQNSINIYKTFIVEGNSLMIFHNFVLELTNFIQHIFCIVFKVQFTSQGYKRTLKNYIIKECANIAKHPSADQWHQLSIS